LITVVAFRVGSDWERLRSTVTRFGTTSAIIAAAILAVGFVAWFIASKRSKKA
jgi:hypothetical protein